MSFDHIECIECPDYNQVYMKANGELYCACEECPVLVDNGEDDDDEEDR